MLQTSSPLLLCQVVSSCISKPSVESSVPRILRGPLIDHTDGFCMRISFYLDKPAAERSTVMLNIAFRGQRMRFGTGVAFAPKHWNSAKQEPKSSSPTVNADRRRLQSIEEFVRSLHGMMEFGDKKRALTANDVAVFKEQITAFLTPPSQKKLADGTSGFLHDFKTFIDTYAVRSKSGMITVQRPARAHYSCTSAH